MSPMSEGTDTSQQLSGDKSRTIAEMREKYPTVRERESLKIWHYHAIAKHDIYGMTWKEVGEIFGKSESYLSGLANSPAGKRFREKINSMEPEEIARITLKAASIDATQDFMTALEWAKEARDYEAVRKMTKDLLEFAEVGGKGGSSDGGSQTINIHLDASSLESPEVSTSYEELTSEPEILEAEVVEDG